MPVLVINGGSSSIKAAVYKDGSCERLLDIRISQIGEPEATFSVDNRIERMNAADHSGALQQLFGHLATHGYPAATMRAVGHRIVHGGVSFTKPVIITNKVEHLIEKMNDLAPLHNPIGLAGVRAAREAYPDCPQVAVFDTAFHSTLPSRATRYALPDDLVETNAIRRFGFHGISHEFVAQATAEFLSMPLNGLRIISCHLGNGCSITAIENGRSVETSMGMTPLEGLVMGTRCGDVDPGVILKLLRDSKLSIRNLDDLLNRRSGLLGMTGTTDMREIETRAAAGDEGCRRAIQVFSHRLRKYIGAYAAAMGGVDVIVFTGGIGENSAHIRHQAVQRFDFLGATLDDDLNRDAQLSAKSPIKAVSSATSRVQVLVVRTDEELAIAQSVNAEAKVSAR